MKEYFDSAFNCSGCGNCYGLRDETIYCVLYNEAYISIYKGHIILVIWVSGLL
jgi:hypothetical protein